MSHLDLMAPDDLILVAGAGGFIGGHLVARLRATGASHIRALDSKPLEQWHQRFPDVESIQADARDATVCRRAVTGARFVYHLAADMGGMGFIETHRADCMLSVLIGAHLLTAARDAGVERFFFSSSACVYNVAKQRTPDVTPLKEEDAYPPDPEDGYGWEKLYTERLCRHFSQDYGLVTRVARYHNVYGPHGTWDGGREKAPAAICRKVAEAKLNGHREIEIWGDGEQTRSFMYIDDCIEGTRRLMHSNCAEPLNLGSNQLITINQLVDIVEAIAGIKLQRRYNLNAPKGVRGRNSDNTRTQQHLRWQPSIPLEQGLAETFAWVYDQVKARNCDISAQRAPVTAGTSALAAP